MPWRMGQGGLSGKRHARGAAFAPSLWHPPPMRLDRPLFALAFGLGAAVFACVSTLPSGSGGGAVGLPPAWSATGGSAPTGEACASCLDHECAAEKAACGADCYAIHACLDSV